MLKASRNAAANVTARNPRYLGLANTFEANETRLARRVRTLADRAAAYWQPALAAVLLAGFLGLSLVLPSLGLQVFNSPDETSDYIFTKTFAETGKLWYTKDYLPLDNVQLQHPRGGLTDGNRIVFYSYLGLPVTYGLLYKVVGDNLQYISIVFAAVSAWALYRACALIFEAKAWEVWAVVLGFTPLIYYLNRPYFNVTPALTLMFVSTWMFARYARGSRKLDLCLASAAAALVIGFRYEYVLFVTPIALWALSIKHGRLICRELALDAAIYCGAVAILFGAPLLYFNRETYGHFTTYGPGLLNRIYFPERTVESSSNLIVGLLRSVRFMLVPSYPPDFEQLAKNASRLTVGLAPVFIIAGVLGAFTLVKEKRLSIWHSGFLVLWVFYVLIYLGTADTFQAYTSQPSFDVSIVRYWLPMYVVAFFLGAYALTAFRGQTIALALVIGLVATGPLSVFRWTDGSLGTLRSDLPANAAKFQRATSLTEPNALIYAGKSDKLIVPYRDVAAWWNGTQFYDARSVAESMANVASTGRPVYIQKESEVDISELNAALAPHRFELANIGGTLLYHLIPAAQYLNPAGPPAPQSLASNAVVFSDEAGSLLVPSAPGSWWQNSPEFSDTSTLAASLARVVATGRPVYVLGNGTIDIEALNELLHDYGLGAVIVPGTPFYQIAAAEPQRSGLIDCSSLNDAATTSKEERQLYRERCSGTGAMWP